MSFLAGIASGVLGKGLTSLFGDAFGNDMTDKVQGVKDDAGIKSAMQGANTPPPLVKPPKTESSPTSVKSALDHVLEGTSEAVGSAASKGISSALGLGPKHQGRDTRKYLQSAFPELNAWEQSGAGASGVGADSSSVSNQTRLRRADYVNQNLMQNKQLANDRYINGINSAVSLKNNAQSTETQRMLGSFQRDKILADIKQLEKQGKLTDQTLVNLVTANQQQFADIANTWARTGKIPFEAYSLLKGAQLAGSKTEGQDISNENAPTANKLGNDKTFAETEYIWSKKEGQDLSNTRQEMADQPITLDDALDKLKKWNKSGAGRR